MLIIRFKARQVAAAVCNQSPQERGNYGRKNLNLSLTTTMNELLIRLGITFWIRAARFRSESRADVLSELLHVPSTALPGRRKLWISPALAIPLVGKTIAVT
jgi:hypothetical protein